MKFAANKIYPEDRYRETRFQRCVSPRWTMGVATLAEPSLHALDSARHTATPARNVRGPVDTKKTDSAKDARCGREIY